MLICLSEIINLWGKQRMWWLHVYLWQQHVSGRAMQVNHKRHNPRWMFWWAPLFPSVCLCFSVGFPQRIDPICCVCCEWIIKAGECFHCQPGLFIPFYFTGSRVWFSNSVASCQNHWSSKISVSGMWNGVEFPNEIQTMHEAVNGLEVLKIKAVHTLQVIYSLKFCKPLVRFI